jgi:transposase
MIVPIIYHRFLDDIPRWKRSDESQQRTTMESKAILGIDVSKATLSVWLVKPGVKLEDGRHQTFANNSNGFERLSAWLRNRKVESLADDRSSVWACLEPTSTYHEAITEYLHDAGYLVSLANPRQVHKFAEGINAQVKTDKQDAYLLARYCANCQPSEWVAPSKEQRRLRGMVRQWQSLKEDYQRYQNHLEPLPASDKELRGQYERLSKAVEKEIDRVYRDIKVFVAEHPELDRLCKLYESVNGVGEVTSLVMVAEMGDMSQFKDPREAVAYAGLVPRVRQSGTSLFTRGGITKRGNKRVRTALYMPAISAKRWDQELKAFAMRLHIAGKPPKVVITAIMRKLLHIFWGIAKSGQPRKIFSTNNKIIIDTP